MLWDDLERWMGGGMGGKSKRERVCVCVCVALCVRLFANIWTITH